MATRIEAAVSAHALGGLIGRSALGLGRQGHDQIEAIVLEVFKTVGPVGQRDADFRHRLDGQGIKRAGLDARGFDIDFPPLELAQHRCGHGRAHHIHRADEQHRGRLAFILRHRHQPFRCKTQMRVKRRRAVSKSVSTLLPRRSIRSSVPSLWTARRPISRDSICDGGAVRMAL